MYTWIHSCARDLVNTLVGTAIAIYHGVQDAEQLANFAKLAEKEGFDSVWITERASEEEAFSMLGVLSYATSRIKLGVGVITPYPRSLLFTVMGAATIDKLSHGRLILGFGRGEKKSIEKLGFSYNDPYRVLEECVSATRTLLAGGKVVYGNFQKYTDISLKLKPYKKQIPIYLAASGPRALRLAGKISDGVILNAYSPVRYTRYAVQEVLKGASEAGRSESEIKISCVMVVRLNSEGNFGHKDLKRRLVSFLSTPNIGEIFLERGGFDPGILPLLRKAESSGNIDSGVHLISGTMVEEFYLLGSVTDVRNRVEEYRKAGVSLPILLPKLEQYKTLATNFM